MRKKIFLEKSLLRVSHGFSATRVAPNRNIREVFSRCANPVNAVAEGDHDDSEHMLAMCQ